MPAGFENKKSKTKASFTPFIDSFEITNEINSQYLDLPRLRSAQVARHKSLGTSRSAQVRNGQLLETLKANAPLRREQFAIKLSPTLGVAIVRRFWLKNKNV
ncbi:hypothetical protein LC613_20120 [Nostoc sphaeroides CHAB 2801]|uniref:hypothetical protein n=1 Tax=Nostoc sphaeroides TaxID=446679 RepID=UPI000E532403|nr:hypothetical protein [Nostoc sphaeroides]MCC5630199.1 hypothetical protein [Nostoc sphaeroides CHAB 2801]